MKTELKTIQATGPDSSRTHLRSVEDMIAILDYRLQPIIDAGTGVVYGYETLIRVDGQEEPHHVDTLYDLALARGFLPDLETSLFERALMTFKALRIAQGTKLYFRLDGRGLGIGTQDPRLQLPSIAAQSGIQASQVCIEFCERDQNGITNLMQKAIGTLRQRGCLIALDDVGRGSSELRLIYELAPDYLKVDRLSLEGIDSDPRRKLFVTTVVNLAHVLGARVIAVGIETEREFKACRDVGCDMIQGAYVAPPFERSASAKLFYDHVRGPCKGQLHREEQNRIRGELLSFPAIQFDATLAELLDMVVHNLDGTVIPVLDSNMEPRGLIHERDLKAYLYAGNQEETGERPSLDIPLQSFVRPCPIADIDSNADMLLVTFASSINSDGIIMTENFRYAGFLSATSLLKIIHEKHLQEAQDQNPLTRLPGNSAVSRYITDVARKSQLDRHLCYLDFDNFKPFNDTYGYKQGDRAIILFGELLQRHLSGSDIFHGHIGGDDFFTGIQNTDQEDVADRMLKLKQAFRLDVESFYEAKHRELGYIEAQDRFGTTRQFPLLECSVSILSLHQGLTLRPNELSEEIAELKIAAKHSKTGLVLKKLREDAS